jgi:haloacetate dehalogenase
MGALFSGFESSHVDVGETTIFIRRKGDGPPLLLLHGFPQTHFMWHRIAPALAERFTTICADLRGYGASGKPVSRPDHSPYSKRTLAMDMVKMMQAQGFTRFCVCGHDRGGRVAYRMALDHQNAIERVAVLDVIPIAEALQRADARLALAFWPWSLLAQPAPLPERLIHADPAAVIDDALANWGSDPISFPPDARSAYIEALRDPEAIHAICEEYRAAATIDVTHDEQDQRDGRRIGCPLLALWSADSALDHWYRESGGPLAIWRAWAVDVTGRSIVGGHFFAEQNPSDTIAALRSFFQAQPL